ncbi:hypothetical protein ISCGN_030832 [Ixodes scapularis]
MLVLQNKTLAELLTTEQALADYVKLLHHIKIKYPFADKAPIIAIGGFYGGMLATYFRLKHPDLITGALASSAPVSMIPGMVPCHAFDYKLTQAFRRESAACEGAIRRSWPLLFSRADTKTKAIGFFQSHRVCPEQVAHGMGFFYEWMRETYIRLAMFNYKEPARRVTLLPRYPLGEACDILTEAYDDDSLVEAVFNVANMFYNHTGDLVCFNILHYFKENPVWNFQMCTELVTTQCSNGDADMLYVRQWNLKKIRENCEKLYKVKPQPRKLYTEYGTRFWNSSNIIFSNGEFDPWTSLGYLSPKTETVIPILIGESAHQEDLAFGAPADRHDLTRAREQERRNVRKWIEEAERKEDTTLVFDPELNKLDRDEF